MENRQSTDANTYMKEMLELSNIDYKAAVIKILHHLQILLEQTKLKPRNRKLF